MPLQGNLRQLRLGDVLETVVQAGQTGSFHVRSGGRRAVVHVGELGLRLLDPQVLDDRTTVDALVQRGVVAREVVDGLRAGNLDDAALLAALEERGELDRRAVPSLLHETVEDCVLDVLTWTDGDFRFEDAALDETALPPGARVLLDPSVLLLRAAQRQEERRAIAERIGSAAVLVLAREDAAPEALDALDDVPRRMLGRLDGRTMLRDASLAEGLTLFAGHCAVASLVDAGVARLPTSPELAARVQERVEAQDVPAALALLRQWQSQAPDQMAPFETAVEIATGSGRVDDEHDALRVWALACQANLRPMEAKRVWERLLERRPGDPGALEGLRAAARELGDETAYSSTSRELAAAALESGDGARAAAILVDLLATKSDDVAARVLLAKALVRAGERDRAVREMARLAQALPTPCRRRADREAATFCRDAVLHLAPDRTDLLRQFRAKVEGGVGGRKVPLIVGGLFLVLGACGLVLWPRPAASLLAQAKEAAGRGDSAATLALLARIDVEHAGTAEAAEAARLRASVQGHAKPDVRAAAADAQAAARATAALNAARAALEQWPAPGHVAPVVEIAAAVRALPAGAAQRRTVADGLREPFGVALNALRRAALERRDALNAAPALVERPPADTEAFRSILDRATAATDPAFAEHARASAAAARDLANALPEVVASQEVRTELRAVESDVESFVKAVSGRAGDLDAARRELHRALVVDAYEKARSEAVKALARGDLDGAEACYGRLEALLAQVDVDPVLRPLADYVKKRGVAAFARARADTLRDLRRTLAAAEAAEQAGDVEGAAVAYARISEQHPGIRFDDVFTIPLRVVPTPPQAVVALDGKSAAPRADGSVVVRYGWGAAPTLTVTAEGFEPRSVVLETTAGKPSGRMDVRLVPRLRWSAAPPAVLEAPLVAVDGDVVLCTRSGRARRHDGRDGTPRWTVDLRSMEGVRGRPVLVGDRLWVPVLEGRMVRVDAANGILLGETALRSRPVGDAAAVDGRVAVAMEDAVALIDGDAEVSYAGSPATVTAGVLAAHRAFWVGDAAGDVTRVDAVTKSARTASVAPRSPIVGLAVSERGVLALSADGTLLAVGPDGEVLWRRPGLGDVIGAPAEAGGVVLVAERGGHVRVVDAATGVVKGDHDLSAAVVGSLVADGGRVGAALADGRVWIHAPGVGTLVDGTLGGTLRVAPAPLGGGAWAVPAAGGTIGVFSFP
ncbi:MAG TPA: PQQ-binding-like beta-propeller repeat protein [Planctomycetota bacterium]|nr:PQQ-binding-like beta-propeller repeat protein [Planctomycetota bacterium]